MASVQPAPFELDDGRHYFAVAAPLDGFVRPLLRTAEQSILIGVLIALLSVPFIVLLATQLAQPMRALAEESERVRRLEVDHTVQIRSRIREVADLAASTNLMRSTLAAFAKYVPRELVRGILESGMAPMPGGGSRPVTLLFTDIEGFTTLSEQIEPEALMLKMSAYLERMVTEIFQHSGTVDKYVGDAIMAYWNAPRFQPDHATLGCRAALACSVLSNTMNREWQAAGEAVMRTRFGLHTGDCIVGNVGSRTRLNFTVLGATVNLASRLEGLNKHYSTQILVSEAIRAAAGPDFVFRPVDVVVTKGSGYAVPIHELVGVRAGSAEADLLPAAALSAQQVAACAAWTRLYELFGHTEWSSLIAEIGAYTRSHPGDQLAAVYLKRAWVNAFSPPEDRAQKFHSK